MLNSNIAINSLQTLRISLGIVELFEKIYDEQPILIVVSNIGEYVPLFQVYYTVIWKQLLISDRNTVRWVVLVLGLSDDGACTDLFENLSMNSLKRDLSNVTTFNPPSFLFGKYF